MDQSSDVFKSSDDHQLLAALKTVGLGGDVVRVTELSAKFEEHSDQLQEVGGATGGGCRQRHLG